MLRLDRLGRSLSHLIAVISDLEHRSIGFVSLTEAIDTQTAGGRLLFHIMGALAEFERALISERTRAGVAAARARGVQVGRPEKLSAEQFARAAELLRARQETIQALSLRYGVSTSTLTRRLSRLGLAGSSSVREALVSD